MSYWVGAYFVFSHHALPKLINPWSKNNTAERHLRGLFSGRWLSSGWAVLNPDWCRVEPPGISHKTSNSPHFPDFSLPRLFHSMTEDTKPNKTVNTGKIFWRHSTSFADLVLKLCFVVSAHSKEHAFHYKALKQNFIYTQNQFEDKNSHLLTSHPYNWCLLTSVHVNTDLLC